MTRDTKGEIVVVSVGAAFLLWLWLRNKAAGQGMQLEGFPPLSATPDDLAPFSPFAIPAAVPGFTGVYDLSAVPLPAPNSFSMSAGQPQSCDCASNQSLANTFGSNADLSAWLAAQPAILASASEAGKWY